MCFSATASFVAAGALSATGALTLAHAKKKELPLASIPLLFGIQQAIEGVIWVTFGFPTLNAVMTYLYLMFAYVLWPIFVPIAVLLIETNSVRKNILRVFSLGGFVPGTYLLYFIFADPGKAHIVNQSIAYDYRHLYELLPLTLYVVVTCGSGLVSSHRILQLFGVAALATFFVANWFYNITFISVWCFFAAILSVLIYWHFKRNTVAERRVETG
ncbi:hypothetical protein HY969_04740 [Candidatus Kaiserbacteria bacterium]|nr:hypothetical protein [Candidatus Kaiserbacteria bacterium]